MWHKLTDDPSHPSDGEASAKKDEPKDDKSGKDDEKSSKKDSGSSS